MKISITFYEHIMKLVYLRYLWHNKKIISRIWFDFLYSKNICVEREETTDDEQDEKNDVANRNKTSKVLSNLFSTSISLSNCFETPTKYECVTK